MFQVRVHGTEPILRIDVIKNNRIVFSRAADSATGDSRLVEFSYRDTDFTSTGVTPMDQIRNWQKIRKQA